MTQQQSGSGSGSSSSDLVQKSGDNYTIRNRKGDSLQISQDEAQQIRSQMQKQMGGSDSTTGSKDRAS